MSDLFLSIGGNLGNRCQNLLMCIDQISKKIGHIEKVSSVYETQAWGFTAEQDFYNQVLWVKTELSVHEVLKFVLLIEENMGRVRNLAKTQKYESRIIDIDILIYDNLCLSLDNIIVPHPHMHERLFVMMPMVEVAADYLHPYFNKSMKQVLETCTDLGRVTKLTKMNCDE
jgi:2-amino-4-hydroxy-6-hydroxymethyldihydropteridine diphosphokinase